MAGQQGVQTTTYRLRRAGSVVLGVTVLVLATLSITGAADVPSVALFMFLAPALALSPARLNADDPPAHLPRWARIARIVQIACLVVGFGLGSAQVLGASNGVAGKLAMFLFMGGIVLTTVLMATSWPAARPEPQR